MDNFQLKTAVAFILFNRPETTTQVFEAIRQAKPPLLLVVADGPRPDVIDDIEKCKAARSVIDRVDWDCEVLTNYSDVNLGCGLRIATGITWVFEQVEQAIILEDDCLPDISFFQYCEQLLNRYNDDPRIMFIGGNSFQLGRQRTRYSYYFSRYPVCWGWATWKRAWKHYDLEIKLWPKINSEKWLEFILEDAHSFQYWQNIFQNVYDGLIDTWDYQWTLACWLQNGLAIVPQINLVRNIGFGPDATHTNFPKNCHLALPSQKISFPLHHPTHIIPHIEADKFMYNYYFNTSLKSRLVRKIQSIVFKFLNRYKR
jgi:hypothetical protein